MVDDNYKGRWNQKVRKYVHIATLLTGIGTGVGITGYKVTNPEKPKEAERMEQILDSSIRVRDVLDSIYFYKSIKEKYERLITQENFKNYQKKLEQSQRPIYGFVGFKGMYALLGFVSTLFFIPLLGIEADLLMEKKRKKNKLEERLKGE